MYCRHENIKPQSVCKECGGFNAKSSVKVLREVHFFASVQCDPQEVLTSLRSNQKKIYLNNEVYKGLRKEIVEWALDLCSSFALRNITAHTAIYLMDLAHMSSTIPKTLFKAIAATCVLIACKSEESSNCPTVNELSENVNGNVKSLELEVLELVNWKIQVATCMQFVEYYSSLGIVFDNEINDIRTVRLVRECAELICDLCIAEHNFIQYLPEDLALVCIEVARKVLGIKPPWTSELTSLASQSTDEKISNEVYQFYLINFPY